jgi:ACS family pantothenate transporter-like MFS transporter
MAFHYLHDNYHTGVFHVKPFSYFCKFRLIDANTYSGFAFFPDIPERTKSRFLTEDEKKLAVRRLEEEGFKPSTGINRNLIKRIFKSWEFGAFVLCLVLLCNAIYGLGTPFILWLKSQPEKYSIPLVNDVGTITNAVAALSAIANSYFSDLRGNRWETIIFSASLAAFANLLLVIWDIPDGLKFFAFISIGWAEGVLPVLITWTAESLAHDLEVRAISLAAYNTIAEITSLVVPLVAWPVSKGPRFRGGYIWVSIYL